MMKKILVNHRWLVLISLFAIVVTTTPYLLGYRFEGDTYKFSGFIIGVEDGNSYIAKMMLGASGRWLFTTPYTAYTQNKFFTFFPYLFLGKLASTPEIRLQLVMIYHLFRIVGIIFLVYETYQFSRLFLEDKPKSILATYLLIFGGGIGWIGVVFPGLVNNRMPLEFYSPETFGFLSIFSLPHLLFGRAFLYKSFRSFIKINLLDGDQKLILFVSGMWLLISAIFQPLNLIIGWAVVGVYLLFKLIYKKICFNKIWDWVYWFLPSSILLLYYFYSFMYDPFLSSWQGQNKIPSPPLFDYFLAYGLGLAAIAIVLKLNWSLKIKKTDFLFIWLLVLPILIYLPINIQRRLSEGVWICFSIFLAFLILELKNKPLRIFSLILLSFPSMLFIFGSINSVRNISIPIYIPSSLEEISREIYTRMDTGDVVMAPFYESNVLPSFIPIKVLTGHGPESMNFVEISDTLDKFYDGRLSNLEISEFIHEFNIQFIIIPDRFVSENYETFINSFEITYQFQNEDYLMVEINEKP